MVTGPDLIYDYYLFLFSLDLGFQPVSDFFNGNSFLKQGKTIEF